MGPVVRRRSARNRLGVYDEAVAGFTRPGATIITLLAMVASFGLLSVSMRTLPLGTAYTVWTGIGAVGAFLIGVVILGEPSHMTRVLAAALIIAGIVLMKVSAS